MNLAEGVLYISSSAFLSFQIVIPALVLRLGGGNVAVGAVPVIVYVGLFLPQIFAARYVESLPWKKGWAIAWGTVQRVAVLLLGIVVLTLAGCGAAAVDGAAPESSVLALWSGLGYYRRARMMHRCAQKLVAECGGKFPRTSEALLALPGIGRYTAAAVASTHSASDAIHLKAWSSRTPA